jgi:hypothetical protein
LGELRRLLLPDGRFVLFISKRNWLTRPLIGRWWDSDLYRAAELKLALAQAGYRRATFRSFPLLFKYLAAWGHIVEATP